jgi:hypothetical protein
MAFQGLLMTGGQVLGLAGAAAGVEVVAVFSVVGIASHDRLSDDKAGWEQGVGDGDRALLSVLFAEAAAQAAQPGADAGPGAGGDPGCLDHRGPEAGFGGDGAIAGHARDDQAGAALVQVVCPGQISWRNGSGRALLKRVSFKSSTRA